MWTTNFSPKRIHNSPCHARRIDNPTSRPFTTSIRRPRLLLHHLPDSILATQPHAPTIHLHRAIENLRLQRMAATGHAAGVVDEDAGEIANDVETSSPLRDLFDHLDDAAFLGDIAVYERRGGFAMLIFDLLLDAAGA